GPGHAAALAAGRRRQALAAAGRLPHLAPLLRRRAGPSRLAAAEQRRADELEEVLLLAGRQPARDPLPEVPPFRPALDGARMAQLARQHAPEAADAHLVAGVAEARPEKESGQVQPPCLVLGRSRARRLERPERVPQRPDRPQRPGVPPGGGPRLR